MKALSGTFTGDVRALLQEASQRAILPRFRKLAKHDIQQKAADDFVTVADRESEEIIAAGLARILPEAAIVGEEASHADPSLLDRLSGLCWIIDPLDGTHNFAHGAAPFGIIVALADAGETLAGWLYDPLSGRFCHARRGAGAFIGEDRVSARTSGLEPPVAAISLLFLDRNERQAIASHIAPHYTVVDIPRCAAEQYPRLALGENDLSIFQRTLPWDHAAGVLWLNEAGGKAARPDGSAYRVDEHALPGLIGAASPALWDALAARLSSLD
ncbi:MAG: inositol monophosphatase family protein [Novosphingobium sp.]